MFFVTPVAAVVPGPRLRPRHPGAASGGTRDLRVDRRARMGALTGIAWRLFWVKL